MDRSKYLINIIILLFSVLTISLMSAMVFAENVIPDIKVNGSDGPVTVQEGEEINVTVALDPGSHMGENADWWVYADSPSGMYYYDHLEFSWKPGSAVTHQGPLFELVPVVVLNTNILPIGTYNIFFKVDLNMNKALDPDTLFADMVTVIVEEEAFTLDPPTGFNLSASGSKATFTWDRSDGAYGYKLYYGTSSRNYTNIVDTGQSATAIVTLDHGTYYWAVTAYTDVIESDYSNEIKWH